MRKIRKKALSSVVSSVLLIAIAIVAVVIVGVFVNNFIKKSLSPNDPCLGEYKIAPPINIEDACYNVTSKELKATLTRLNKEAYIESIGFLVDFDSKRDVWSCEKSCSNCEILQEGTKDYFISLSQEGTPKSLTLRINNCILETKEVSDC